jgi:hypothetical protein
LVRQPIRIRQELSSHKIPADRVRGLTRGATRRVATTATDPVAYLTILASSAAIIVIPSFS